MAETLRHMLFAIMFFIAIVTAGVMIYTGGATTHNAPVDSRMITIQTTTNQTFNTMKVYAEKNLSEDIQVRSGDIVSQAIGTLTGGFDAVWGVTNLLWGILLTIFSIPTMLFGISTEVFMMLGINPIFASIIVIIITLFIVFELVSLIFKRET